MSANTPKPAFKTLGISAADKAAALVAADHIVEAARYKATPEAKPWLLVDPKGRAQEVVRMTAPTHAKLMYVYQHLTGEQRTSKNLLMAAAIDKYMDELIAELEKQK